MQIFQPLEPEDFGLVKGITPKKEDLAAFCAPYSEVQQGACWREGWPLYYKDIQKPQGLVSFCSKAPTKEEQRRCYNAMFYVLTAQFNFDEQKITALCKGLPSEVKGQCFANAASRMIETDYSLINKASRMCDITKEYTDPTQCYEELISYSTFNFHAGSPQALHLCATLPDSWRERCRQKNNVYEIH